ncbi:glycine-rich domain-containing protein [Kitasatospora sp. NPDC087271]|uniref:glycine-rich domain-containing protein n=1 Tax=Kitasatospora sp. NPDC087271 TaxID=3364067 RepID=UPI00381497C4
MIIPEPTPALAPPPTAPDQFVSTATFDSAISTVLSNNEGMDVAMTTRITREAIAFVVVGARRPHLAMAPSRIVDEGWHALLVHTEAYAELCEREGRFVHHSPGFDPGNFDQDIMEQTQAAIREAGFEVDQELWRPPTDDSLVTVAASCQHSPSCSIRPMKKPEKPCTKPAE